jgi:MFS transporter, DHA1 family, tetracycline resistance protein
MPLFIIVLIDLLGLTIIIPLLPLYAVAFGADAITVGALAAVYPAMQLFSSPVLGGLSDRYGRKPILVLSQIGTFIAFMVLGLAQGLTMIFVARAIDGFTGGNIVVARAAMTDQTTQATRTQGLGLLGAAFGLGFTIGPAISSIALALTGNDIRVPAFIAAGFSLLSIVLALFWFRETLPREVRQARVASPTPRAGLLGASLSAFRNPAIGPLLLVIFIHQMVFGGFENLLALFTLSRIGLNALGNALLFVFVGVLLVIVQGRMIGPWSRRYGEPRLIVVGIGLMMVGLFAFALTPNQAVPWYSEADVLSGLAGDTEGAAAIAIPLPPEGSNGWLGLLWLAASVVPLAIGASLVPPSVNSLISQRAAAEDVGSALGASSSLQSAANVVTPVAGGGLFQALGPSSPFVLGGLAMGVMLFWAPRILRATPGGQETPPAAPA